MAALKLMAERGMEGVAINEITEAADVGFGSFYNHFDSKEAIYAAVLEWVFEDFADAMERVTGEIADPAELIAASPQQAPALNDCFPPVPSGYTTMKPAASALVLMPVKSDCSNAFEE